MVQKCSKNYSDRSGQNSNKVGGQNPVYRYNFFLWSHQMQSTVVLIIITTIVIFLSIVVQVLDRSGTVFKRTGPSKTWRRGQKSKSKATKSNLCLSQLFALAQLLYSHPAFSIGSSLYLVSNIWNLTSPKMEQKSKSKATKSNLCRNKKRPSQLFVSAHLLYSLQPSCLFQSSLYLKT